MRPFGLALLLLCIFFLGDANSTPITRGRQKLNEQPSNPWIHIDGKGKLPTAHCNPFVALTTWCEGHDGTVYHTYGIRVLARAVSYVWCKGDA